MGAPHGGHWSARSSSGDGYLDGTGGWVTLGSEAPGGYARLDGVGYRRGDRCSVPMDGFFVLPWITPAAPMPEQWELVSLLVVAEFVVMGSILLLLVPLEVAAPVIPMLLVFAVVLALYLI